MSLGTESKRKLKLSKMFLFMLAFFGIRLVLGVISTGAVGVWNFLMWKSISTSVEVYLAELAENIKTTGIISMFLFLGDAEVAPLIGLLVLILLVTFVPLWLFVHFVIRKTRTYDCEQPIHLLPQKTAGRVICMILCGIAMFIPMVYTFIGTIGSFWAQLYLYLYVICILLTYYRFSCFLLREVHAPKWLRILLPSAFFIIGEVLARLAESCVMSVFFVFANATPNFPIDSIVEIAILPTGLSQLMPLITTADWWAYAYAALLGLTMGMILAGFLYQLNGKWYLAALPLILFFNLVSIAPDGMQFMVLIYYGLLVLVYIFTLLRLFLAKKEWERLPYGG